MKVKLFDFQEDALLKLQQKASIARQHAGSDNPQVIVFSAPTGSGKTIILTALFETIFFGDAGFEPQPDAVILWVSDMPELNEQTRLKIEGKSNRIKPRQLVTIDATFDFPRLESGHIYFINTQKLGTDKKLTRTGDGRQYPIWETLTNTAKDIPDRFYVLIDEAHRGMLGNRQAQEARTLMQRFLLGFPADGLVKMSLVVGVSATPQRFVDMLQSSNHTQHRVIVPTDEVRKSGLLKDRVVIHFPESPTTANMSLLEEASRRWAGMESKWAAYCDKERQPRVRPILLVQVEDGKDNTLTKTDLAGALQAIENAIGRKLREREVAHAMQESGNLPLAGWTLRKIEASRIEEDADVGVVFFKTSLSTGWDCPRAEVMMSFRAAQDHTYIAQLMGRMIRTPLARRIEREAELNDVHLFLPRFDKTAVEAVIEALKNEEQVPPSETGTSSELVILSRREELDAVFEAMNDLVTYRVNAVRAQSHLKRLMGLSLAMTNDELDEDARESAREKVVGWMEDKLKSLKTAGEFEDAEKRVKGVGLTTITLDATGESRPAEQGYNIEASIVDLERQFGDAGRRLSSGLNMAFWEKHGDRDALDVKVEVIVLATNHDAMAQLEANAEAEFDRLYDKHKRAIGKLREHRRTVYERLRLATDDPVDIPWMLPNTIDFRRPPKAPTYDRHLYVEGDGKFRADLGSWERAVIEEELADEKVVAWLRNGARKQWALEIPRNDGAEVRSMFPDFVVVEKKGKDYLFSILEPHNPSLDDNVGKAKGLAAFAAKHGDLFDRIQLIREMQSPAGGKTFRRLDLNDSKVQKKVEMLSNKTQLDALFDSDAT